MSQLSKNRRAQNREFQQNKLTISAKKAVEHSINGNALNK